jgi:hypothetical protein
VAAHQLWNTALDFEVSNCRLATAILRALAVFDFPDIEDEEDGLSSFRLSSRLFSKGAGLITAATCLHV